MLVTIRIFCENSFVTYSKRSGRKYTLHLDGARSHRPKSTQSFLDQNVSDYISTDDWPGNSPDLNPLDYSIWGAMDKLVSVLDIKLMILNHSIWQLGKLFHKIS